MSDEAKKVPIAYVTKWATTAGILVVRDAERGYSNPEYLRMKHSLISPKHWTASMDLAEQRWRDAMYNAVKAAERKVAKLKSDAAAGPKVTER